MSRDPLPPPSPFNLSTLPSASSGLAWHRVGEEATPVSYGPRQRAVSQAMIFHAP